MNELDLITISTTKLYLWIIMVSLAGYFAGYLMGKHYD